MSNIQLDQPATPAFSLEVTDGVSTVIGVDKISFSGATVSGASPDATVTIEGGSSLTLTDGTNTVADVAQITVTGGIVGGTTPDATLDIASFLTPAGGSLEFYVSNSGSDSNPGTISEPFATLQHAADVAGSYNYYPDYQVGITVEDGTYESVSLPPLYPYGNSFGYLVGDPTPANCLINAGATAYGIRTFGNGSNWLAGGFAINGASIGCQADQFSYFLIEYYDMEIYDSTEAGALQVLSCASYSYMETFENTFLLSGTRYSVLYNANTYSEINLYSGVTFSGSSPTVAHLAYSYGNSSIYDDSGDYGGYTGTISGPQFDFSGFAYYFNVYGYSSVPGTSFGQVDNTSSVQGVFGGGIDHKIASPSTGATVTFAGGQLGLILTPSGALASLTVTLPPITTYPTYLATAWVSTTQTITSLTVNSGDGSTVTAPPTTLLAGQRFKMVYDYATTTWYPGG